MFYLAVNQISHTPLDHSWVFFFNVGQIGLQKTWTRRDRLPFAFFAVIFALWSREAEGRYWDPESLNKIWRWKVSDPTKWMMSSNRTEASDFLEKSTFCNAASDPITAIKPLIWLFCVHLERSLELVEMNNTAILLPTCGQLCCSHMHVFGVSHHVNESGDLQPTSPQLWRDKWTRAEVL